MTITQRAGDAAVILLRVFMTLELGQVEHLTLDQTPALDVGVKQRTLLQFIDSPRPTFD